MKCAMFQIAKIVKRKEKLQRHGFWIWCCVVSLTNKEMKTAHPLIQLLKTLCQMSYRAIHVHHRNFLWFRPNFWMRMVRISKCFFPHIWYRIVADISVVATRLWPWILGIWAILWDACLASSGMRVRIPVVPILATHCSCHRTLAQWSWIRPRWFSRW